MTAAGQLPGNPVDAQIITAYVADLERALAPDRLAPYRPAGGDDLAMAATYFWIVALSRELYLSLGAVEVTMRNGIHDGLTAHFGNPTWYDRPGLLLQRDLRDLHDAKRRIVSAGRSVVPGRVIAALSFGFWTSLLSKGYGNRLWSPNNAALIRQAFPRLQPPNQDRGHVHDRFNTIRTLRNRVSHHEPIWRGVVLQSGRIASLADLYANIVDAIGWVSPTMQSSVVAFDRFPDVLRNGSAPLEVDIKQYLGIA